MYTFQIALLTVATVLASPVAIKNRENGAPAFNPVQWDKRDEAPAFNPVQWDKRDDAPAFNPIQWN